MIKIKTVYVYCKNQPFIFSELYKWYLDKCTDEYIEKEISETKKEKSVINKLKYYS